MYGSLFQRELMKGGYGPHFFAYYYKQWNGYEMPYHQHDATEIMYIISGKCRVDVLSGGKTEHVALRKGDFILLDAGVSHRLLVEPESSCRMLNTEFGFTDLRGGAPSLFPRAIEEKELSSLLAVPFTHLVLTGQEEVYPVLKSLVLELDQRGTERGMMTDLLFVQLLVRIARLYAEKQKSAQQHSELYVKRCVDFLHQNYDQDIRVQDAAETVNLHPSYLQRIFRKGTGKTLTAYLTMIRMEKAAMLLEQTDIPIHEISEYVGVGSRQYFHLLFKKYSDQTPVEYRMSKGKMARHYESEAE
ncbi:AraC family transcriptional regulator [Paenibacillus lemnae]|uniref:AraC family transcriptional regulator n=1 Tax=Paenibacillus lemnae TaxID=1330551 RepID=A0A848M6G1_PAELE|nr:AraC family transcriptional regulator [Paenibacillus lemnae]NMO95184.1 AraC family transcriptional regulator [Paenibacillus lemnae]